MAELPKGLLVFFLSLVCAHSLENIYTTQVFITPIPPSHFNWTSGISRNGYWLRASKAESPDLPSWINYVYSHRRKTGYIYGVPPNVTANYKIEVVSVDRDSYQTARRLIKLNVTEKPDSAKYEVHLKIDNMNVEDLFEGAKLDDLTRVFTSVLWPDCAPDIYLTFLTSALKLGARLPLKPNESDGVVLRLGSSAPFSDDLVALQEEVKPLWKLTSCPRDFKKTTVDRHFRAVGFILDWCSFRLEKKGEGLWESGKSEMGGERWTLPQLSKLERRSYLSDLLATLLLPSVVLLLMALLLSLVLCFHHEPLSDPSSDQFFESLLNCQDLFSGKEVEERDETLIQYEAVQRATNTLRSMSNNRDTQSTNRVIGERKEAGRPSPPPYEATRRIVNMDS